MSNSVTTIEGFEIVNGIPYFTAGLLGSGGVVGTANAPTARPPNVATHNTCLLTFAQGWCRIPVDWGADGEPDTGLLSWRSMVIRVYYSLPFGPPANATTVFAVWRSLAGTAACRVEVDALRQLSVDGIKGPVPTTLNLGTWYRIELHYEQTGLRELRIDGITEYSANVGAGATFDSVQFGDERITGSGGHIFDDVMILSDRVGPLPDDVFPGEGEVHRLYINGVGSVDQWNLGAGASKQAAVNENPPDGDVSYITNPAVANRRQLFTFQPISPIIAASTIPGAVVKAVRASTINRSVVGSPQWHHVSLLSGATTDETTVDSWAGAYRLVGSKVWEDDPDTAAPWTAGAVDAVESGLRIANNIVGRSTNVILLVDIGEPFPVAAGRAKLNPVTLGPSGPTMLSPRTMGA